ncbi:SoxY-related AACIE arm protein [Pseudorhodoferax sp.]|uniref:SoxY-related AACIE arm protein n=1 Tax=Pseudorhodoferax sp. TaxID=1993553 RepID=UPI002DD647C1|nr:SoxY-related AACIE arm protein [Pseudorhodoferax sp.]
MTMRRRPLLLAGLLPLWPGLAPATPEALASAVAAFVQGAPVQPGRITLQIAELVENGNTVPLAVSVESAMTADDHVRSLALFTARNPQPEVAVFHFSRLAARAEVATRIRLATSQQIIAVAKMGDGRCWHAEAGVIVTLAACVES